MRKNLFRCLRIEMLTPLPILLLFLSTAVVAQEVGYLDLTDVRPRTTLRYPPAPPPACKDGVCVSGGFGGGSVACGAGDWRDPRALETTLTWLDRIDYQIGSNIEFEIKVENTGSEAMMIPWTPHLADLQPTDESQPFQYLELDVSLDIKTESGGLSSPLAYLYGSKETDRTIIELTPGAWVRIKGSAALRLDENSLKRLQQASETAGQANASFGYRHDTFHPGRGGYRTEIVNDYPRSQQGDPLLVRLHAAAEGDAPAGR